MSSANGLPTICNPIGIPEELNPQGTDTAGVPAKLKGPVKLMRPAKPDRACSLLCMPGELSTRGAVTGPVGKTNTSTFSKASSICCLRAVRIFWAL